MPAPEDKESPPLARLLAVIVATKPAGRPDFDACRNRESLRALQAAERIVVPNHIGTRRCRIGRMTRHERPRC
jgi:hypothetical protein